MRDFLNICFRASTTLPTESVCQSNIGRYINLIKVLGNPTYLSTSPVFQSNSRKVKQTLRDATSDQDVYLNTFIFERNQDIKVKLKLKDGKKGGITAQGGQDVAEETQHAICNISTQGVQTSANASITRQLKGICTSNQLDMRFKELESKLIKEINSIKELLSRIPFGNSRNIHNSYPSNVLPEYSDNFETKAFEENDDVEEILPIFNTFKDSQSRNYNELDRGAVLLVGEKKSIISKFSSNPPRVNMQDLLKSTVDIENKMYLNNTLHKSGTKFVFHYFWKVENFNELMAKFELYRSSPSFLVLGHELDIQIFPNQPQQYYLTIKLRASRSFLKKHTFSILRRTTTGENINSAILRMNPQGADKFLVTLISIKNSECLKDDSIIIALNIYL